MIDEKRLIEEFKHLSDGCNLFRWRKPQKIREGIIHIIRIQPKIGEWIPCSERLPEKLSDVLLSLRSPDIHTGFRTMKEGMFYVNGVGFVECENVMAWQPLPEPYKVYNILSSDDKTANPHTSHIMQRFMQRL